MEQGNPLTGEPVTTTTGTGHGDLPHYYVQTTESLILEELRAIRRLLEKKSKPVSWYDGGGVR